MGRYAALAQAVLPKLQREAAEKEKQEADYKAVLKKIPDTQRAMDSVVAYIISVNYKDFPNAVELVQDGFNQLSMTKGLKAKHEGWAAMKDWGNANLVAEQIFQYQLRAMDPLLRAKSYLEQNGAKKVK